MHVQGGGRVKKPLCVSILVLCKFGLCNVGFCVNLSCVNLGGVNLGFFKS